MFPARILIISLFIVYSNKYSFEQFTEFLSNHGGLANVFNFLINSRHEFREFFESSIKVLIVVSISAGAFFGVALFLFCKKPSTFQVLFFQFSQIFFTILVFFFATYLLQGDVSALIVIFFVIQKKS